MKQLAVFSLEADAQLSAVCDCLVVVPLNFTGSIYPCGHRVFVEWRDALNAPLTPTQAEASNGAGVDSGVPADVRESPTWPLDFMVNRFLSWPLPASVCSDACAMTPNYPMRTGTNLLTAAEARQMLKHVLSPGGDE